MYVSQAYFNFAQLSGCSPLQPCYSKCVLWTNSLGISWELDQSVELSCPAPDLWNPHPHFDKHPTGYYRSVALWCTFACLPEVNTNTDCCIWRIPEYFLRCSPLEAIVLGVRRLGFWPPVMAKHPVLPWVSPVSTLHLSLLIWPVRYNLNVLELPSNLKF